MTDVTRILSQIESGDGAASEQLLPLVYNELRRLAAAKLAQEKPGRLYKRRRWSMKRICGWSIKPMCSRGTVAAISLLLRLTPCGAFWSNRLGNAKPKNTAAIGCKLN